MLPHKTVKPEWKKRELYCNGNESDGGKVLIYTTSINATTCFQEEFDSTAMWWTDD